MSRLPRPLVAATDQGMAAVATALVPLTVAGLSSSVGFGQFALLQLPVLIWITAVKVSIGGAILVSPSPSAAAVGAVPLMVASSSAPILGIVVTALFSGYELEGSLRWGGALVAWGLGCGLMEISRASRYGRGRYLSASAVSATQLLAALLMVGGGLANLEASLALGVCSFGTLCLGAVWAILDRRASAPCPLDWRRGRGYLFVYAPTACLAFAAPWVLNWSFGPAVTGGYRLAQTVAGMLVQPSQVLQQYLFSKAAIQFKQDGNAPVLHQRLYLGIGSVFTIGGALALVQSPEGWGQSLLGPSWTLARYVLLIVAASLAVAQVATALENSAKARNGLGGYGRYKFVAVLLTVGLMLFLGSNNVLATISSILVMNIGLVVYLEAARLREEAWK